jgi:hypothetical protein
MRHLPRRRRERRRRQGLRASLQRGTDEIVASLERIERERMIAELQVFAAALEHDLIDATDFAPR